MAYKLCEFCRRLMKIKHPLQKYHRKCKKEAHKAYRKTNEVKDRNNYNSLIRRLNKKEKEYKERLELKYLKTIILFKKFEETISLGRRKDLLQGKKTPKELEKEFIELFKTKKSIEESETFHKKKIDLINSMRTDEMKNRLSKLKQKYPYPTSKLKVGWREYKVFCKDCGKPFVTKNLSLKRCILCRNPGYSKYCFS